MLQPLAPEPSDFRNPTTSIGDELEESLIYQHTLLQENTEENGTGQMLPPDDDASLSAAHRAARQKWRKATHLITAIIQLRTGYPHEDYIELLFSVRFSSIRTTIHSLCLIRKCTDCCSANCPVSSFHNRR